MPVDSLFDTRRDGFVFNNPPTKMQWRKDVGTSFVILVWLISIPAKLQAAKPGWCLLAHQQPAARHGPRCSVLAAEQTLY